MSLWDQLRGDVAILVACFSGQLITHAFYQHGYWGGVSLGAFVIAYVAALCLIEPLERAFRISQQEGAATV